MQNNIAEAYINLSKFKWYNEMLNYITYLVARGCTFRHVTYSCQISMGMNEHP